MNARTCLIALAATLSLHGVSVAAPPVELVAVRVDKATYAETRLGTLRFDGGPPHRATVVDGGAQVKALAAEMNALVHVVAAGGSRIGRAEDQFFRILRNGWLRDRDIRLRAPAPSTALRRHQVIAFAEGKADVTLGTVAVDDLGYLQVIDGPTDQRAKLGKLTDEANDLDGEATSAAPPTGSRGSWSRLIARGTDEFAARQRDRLYDRGVLMLPEGTSRAGKLLTAGANGLARRWVSVHVGGGLTPAPPQGGGPHVVLSGPPGGPLGVSVADYQDVAYTAAALTAFVTRAHGREDAFAIGAPAELEVAGRKLLAVAYQSGKPPARAVHVVILWPAGERGSYGVIVDMFRAGGDKLPASPAQVLDHPALAIAAASLRVDFASR